MARDEEEVRREITLMHASLDGATHYELLGIERESFEKSKLGGIFRNLAKQWHIDRFSTMDLGEDREKVQQIFAAINTAHRTLSDDAAREEYDLGLEGDAGEDLAALLNSENLFLKGKNILRQGAYKGAYDHFKDAYELNEMDNSILAHMLYTEYLMLPKSAQGKPLVPKRAEEIDAELSKLDEQFENDDWFRVFLGTVALGLGREKRAKYLFQEALLLNPGNMDAKRQQRLIEMRAEREANKGFFAKLMERFKS